MKNIFYISFIGCALLAGCTSSDDTGEGSDDAPKKLVAKGDVAYGGSFTLSTDEIYSTLFPYQIEDYTSAQIGIQIHEGLVKFNPGNLEVVPAIAEKYDVSDDLTEYTFHLKEGVMFHDDPCFDGGKGREVTADDFVFSFQLLCSPHSSGDNSNFENTFKDVVLGANEYFRGEGNLEGVEKVDDRTLKIKLVEPRANFIYKLANVFTSVVAKEAWEAYGDDMKVGAGPFVFENDLESESGVYLTRNPDYHMVDKYGNQLPYLDTIHFKYVDNLDKQLDLFQNGDLSMIYGIPANKVSEVVSQNIQEYSSQPPQKVLSLEPEMVTQYYEFNLTRDHFKDPRVRQAFNYAIDRKKLIKEVLNNQAFKYGQYGITPPLRQFKGLDTAMIAEHGYTYQPEKAQRLLAEAGYPNGKGFPTIKLTLNSGGLRNTRVAKEIQRQLQNTLNVNINYDVKPFAEKMEDAKYARVDMVRSAWVADYPSPETFLLNFYGKNVPESLDEPSHPNTMRYVNPAFDAALEAGMAAPTLEEQYQYFSEAEKIMLQDAPVIILWYGENYKLFHAEVRNFRNNAMKYLDLTRVYIKPWTEEEWRKNH